MSQLKSIGELTISSVSNSEHSRDEKSVSSSGSLKHPQSQILSEPPLKKRRPELARRHTLGPESSPEGFAAVFDSSPSPLLPSPTKQRPGLAPRPATSHAVAAIRNKVREDSGGITTFRLARGSVGNASHQGPSHMPGNLMSLEKSNAELRPDRRSTQSGLELLGKVGIVELLEQDERPTFIIDVANPANFTPGGPLQIVFANASLRAHESILEAITSKADLDAPGVAVTNTFPAFKAWALSFVKNNESLNVSLPSFLFEGVYWTSSTLQKRLRVISCTCSNILTAARPTSSNGGPSNLSPFGDVRGQPSSNNERGYFTGAVSEASNHIAVSRKGSWAEPSQQQVRSSPDVEDSNRTSFPRESILISQPDGNTIDSVITGYPGSSSFDWTRIPMSAALPRHIQFARSVDWASTPLGPIENWTFDLRAICNLVMGSPHPAAMFWGDNYISIYNEAYIHLAGQKHPAMMGQSYNLAWAEIWPGVEEAFSNAMRSGQATMKDDDCLFLKRDGRLEETYFSWSIIPLVGEDGSVVGIYNPAFDKTRRKIAERRMLTLREIGERTAAAREMKGFWSQVIKGLEYNKNDVPFMLLYSVSEDVGLCVLEGSLGVPQGHRSAESPLDLQKSNDGFAPYLRESMKSKGAVLLTIEDGTLSYDLIEGLVWRGWGDPCRAVVVFPIYPTTGESILGFLIMGVNPRRPYDDEYSLFIQLLSRQLATSMASVMLFEEEIRRGQLAARLADLERQELSRQLDLRTQEAVESETKFTRMAEFAPVGMFIANSSGGISYSNDTWWEISRHPTAEKNADTWMESIHDEDREGVRTVWKKLVEERSLVTHEFRFKTPWQDRSGNRGDTWVLMSAYPERDENGQLKSVFGSITNISQQKWAEDFQKRRMEEAFESKRQQDNFIDMTSHEMRNPLSAILQSADEIGMSLSEFLSSLDESAAPQKLTDLLDNSIEAAQTISLCAQHQASKRIVDDILTLSKLDSALLIVTPVAVQPASSGRGNYCYVTLTVYQVAVVQRALRMFEGELDSNDIALEFRVQKTFLDMRIDWVKLDPSRLLQVLINLTTNAIKFTSGQDKRVIVVSVGASSVRPNTTEADVSYFPSRLHRTDLTADEGEWGSGENIYLHFAVQDTGRGLDESEKTLLFQRFRQASPRTHVQYGGSGLGLFISRELTELQGGEIGVASERGIGSTFAFYIKARRAEDMPQDTPISTSVNSLVSNSSNPSAASFAVENRRTSSGMPVYRSNTKSKVRRSSAISSSALLSATRVDYSKLKALIVEDNLVNQRVLQKQLRNIGFDTEVANHGGEALEVLKTSRYWSGREQDGKELAIILMDLEMPVMDGLTCARTIRNLERAGSIVKHVPIIAVTANVRLEQIELAISAGMDDVVSKPFRIPELMPKIEDLVSRNATTSWGVLPAKPVPAESSA